MKDDNEAYRDGLVAMYDSLEQWAIEYGIPASVVEKMRADMAAQFRSPPDGITRH